MTVKKRESGLSPRFLEAIVRGDEAIEPKHLDITYEQDKYVVDFCGWEEFCPDPPEEGADDDRH